MQNSKIDTMIENLINKKLNIVSQENTMLNHNFIMRFKILKKMNSLEETYINTILPYTTYEAASYLSKTIEMKKISDKDLIYTDEHCDMSFFTSWFYENDGEIVTNKINPIRNEILYHIEKYMGNFNVNFYTIKDEPPELIDGNPFSTGFHLFIVAENKILMFEFSMFD